jgi:hypothetical protein
MRPSRIVALVMGCLLVIPSIAVLFGGGTLAMAYAFGRDDDGYFDATLDRLSTDTVAITADDITLGAEPGSPDWIIDALDADVRIRATGADPESAIFIGIARQEDVDAYLAGVAHDEIIEVSGRRAVYRTQPGTSIVDAPGDQTFWTVSATGTGTQQLDWEATSGRWSVLAMNADATPGVAVDVNVGAKAGFVLPLAVTMVVIGALLTALAVVLVVVGASDARRSSGTPQPLPPLRSDLESTPDGHRQELTV